MRWWIAAAFFLVSLAARLPLATENLWAHDSLLYARAIERFDPLDQRPQAPGYLYYVWLIRALFALTGDANRAMTLVSAFAGAAAIALLYLFASRLYDERTGLASALFLGTGVTFWAYGGVAYPYALLALLTISCAWLFWRASHGERRARRLVLASAAWAIAVGFREDLGVFLAPLWLFAAWSSGIAAAAASVAVAALLGVAWLVLSAAADGGMAAFLEANRAQSTFVQDRYSVFGIGTRAILRNGYDLARFLGRGLYALTPLVGAAILSGDGRRSELREPRRVAFVLLWALSPLPVYVLVHVGEYGYVFSMLPGLCVVAARGAVALVKGMRVPRLLPWVIGAIAAANAAIFLFTPTPLSRFDLERRDRGLGEKVAYLRANVDPAQAAIVTVFDTILVDHYLEGDYRLIAYDPDASPSFATTLDRPIVVLWEDLLRAAGPGWTEEPMPHGARLRIARVAQGATLQVREGLLVELVPR